MRSWRNFTFGKNARNSTIATITSCLVFTFFVLNLAPTSKDDESESSNDRIKLYEQVREMPGGDGIPSAPPWTIPPADVITEPEQLDEGDRRNVSFVTTKFFMSPGLGNQMFQYAAVYVIAQRLNAQLVLPEGALIRRAFELDSASTIVSNRLSMHLLKSWKRKFYYQCCRYYNETEQLSEGVRYALYGYFQSYRYFEELRPEIVNQFQFLPEIQRAARNHLHAAIVERGSRTQLVGVHVRRGLDLMWNSRNQQHGHTVAPKNYFMRAIAYFRRKFNNDVLFIVCTDDLYWSRQTFEGMQDVYVVNSKVRETDLCVLSMCNHTIMSQGTFSWWAAYLAGGETIYYDGWPRPGSELDSNVVKDDFFMPQWIPML